MKNQTGAVDGIHAGTLKILRNNDNFVNAILFILNNFSFSGFCPTQFKIAELMPVFKAGERDSPGNYSPISLVSNITKLYEELQHSRIMRFSHLNPPRACIEINKHELTKEKLIKFNNLMK